MPIKKDGKTLLTQEDLQPIFDIEGVIDGSKGGLLLGNYHIDGGIKVIREYDKNHYEVVAELEGWEFILCAEATYWDVEYLHSINNEIDGSTGGFIEYEIPNNISILDTRPIFENIKETNRIIKLGEYPHFIINKHSTKKYLNELDELNKKYSR